MIGKLFKIKHNPDSANHSNLHQIVYAVSNLFDQEYESRIYSLGDTFVCLETCKDLDFAQGLFSDGFFGWIAVAHLEELCIQAT